MYPNPFVDQIHIEFAANFNTTASVLMYSLNGSVVYQKNISLYTGNNSITIDNINNLISGVYAIKIVDVKSKQTMFQSKAIKK
ncbi:T9SS type A sorting domain-containing protein [Rhizosphaericola mali]|uniref:T9SS type A sorting domain-containing protein n=1 Tax=Rhizosphaericola mali TaxID=2545455 RepID=A0A5P2FUP7_9BACT|nr:T9SS type A sorting domain-containing protein [Rhizosphaericola mali]QES87186.1 T9SS type A sorting domain-containing protein [Rhizosphaericola mali]